MVSEGLHPALDSAGCAIDQPADEQMVSLQACFQELALECLSPRTKFVEGQRECLEGDRGLKVPAGAVRAWIRGMLSTPDQLQALDTNSLIRRIKMCFNLCVIIYCCLSGVRSSYHRVVPNVV